MLHEPQDTTMLYPLTENARNTMNSAQAQLVHELQMEFDQQPTQTSFSTMVYSFANF